MPSSSEQAEAARKTFEVKIFATDTAEDSLGPARRGIFPAAIEHAIPQERLRRFFEPVGDMYRWRVVDEERKPVVRRRWQESGGPEVKPPTRSRFRLGLIKRAVSYELDGTTMVEFRPEGFRCEIALPYRPELFQVH